MTISHRIGIAMTLLVCGCRPRRRPPSRRGCLARPRSPSWNCGRSTRRIRSASTSASRASAGRFVRPPEAWCRRPTSWQVAASEAALRQRQGPRLGLLAPRSRAIRSTCVYAGPALSSGQRCFWRVRVWDGAGTPSGWSEPATWEIGPAAALRLESGLDRAGSSGGPQDLWPLADAPPRVRPQGPGAQRAGLCDEPRPLRDGPQRAARRRTRC